MSAAAQRHMARVASIGCILCRHLGTLDTPAHVHHLREGVGAAQRQSHYLTVPLCPPHHTGPDGLHGLGTRGFYTRYKMDELDLLALTLEALE